MMTDINASEIVQSLLQNQFFIGIVLSALIMSVFYSLREIPKKIWGFLKWKTVAVLTVHSTDDIFPWLDKWLSENTRYGERCRRLRINEDPTRGNDDESCLGVGLGNHYFFHGRSLVKIEREEMQDAKTGHYKLNEKMVLSSLSKRAIVDIFRQVLAKSKKREDLQIMTNDSYGGFSEIRGISPRPIDTVYCEGDKIDKILTRISSFFDSRSWYVNRGIPWRLGLFLSGPPGTGKSSITRALAGHLHRSLYVIHLGSLANDSSLFENMRQVPPGSIVLMEDVDCAGSTSIDNRDNSESNKAVEKKISLSALLNAIDGVMSPEGRVLIMTSNHPEKIDPALMREGRVDLKIELSKIGPSEIERMMRTIFGSHASIDPDLAHDFYANEDGWTPSYAQEIMIRSSNEYEAIKNLTDNPR